MKLKFGYDKKRKEWYSKIIKGSGGISSLVRARHGNLLFVLKLFFILSPYKTLFNDWLRAKVYEHLERYAKMTKWERHFYEMRFINFCNFFPQTWKKYIPLHDLIVDVWHHDIKKNYPDVGKWPRSVRTIPVR